MTDERIDRGWSHRIVGPLDQKWDQRKEDTDGVFVPRKNCLFEIH